jgi:hypothetical protein
VESAISSGFRSGETKNMLVFGMKFMVSQEAVALCDGCIEIPQLGTKHSLNISVSRDCSLGFISKMNWPSDF